jgi:NAD(P)-dependent dehydrogenase (short-subunit alcohol dehydrogenase family)
MHFRFPPLSTGTVEGGIMYDLNGKAAIVTGVARRRGIGRAIALRLAAEGCDLVVMDIGGDSPSGSLDDALRETVSEMERMGRKAVAVTGDVSRKEDVQRMAQECLAHLGKIDILVNNAGIGGPQLPVVKLPEEDWDRILRINTKGTFLCSQMVANEMIKRGKGGKIVNIASQAGKRGFVFQGGYCASKFAIIGLTQVMALELARYGIHVNAVCPGTVDTDMIDTMFSNLSSFSKHTSEEIKEKIIKQQIPLGRLERPEEVTNLVAWLVSAEADYMTGESINITGGQTMD